MHKQSGPIPWWGHSHYSFALEMFVAPNILELIWRNLFELGPLPISHMLSQLMPTIELMINKTHGLSPPGGLVSPSGGFASLLFDQVGHFASIKLCLVLSHQGAIIKIPVVRCHCLWCLGAQLDSSNYWDQCHWQLIDLEVSNFEHSLF